PGRAPRAGGQRGGGDRHGAGSPQGPGRRRRPRGHRRCRPSRAGRPARGDGLPGAGPRRSDRGDAHAPPWRPRAGAPVRVHLAAQPPADAAARAGVTTARLFVAAIPPVAVLDQVAALPRPEVEGLRWTTRDQWHVTLRFLGRVADVDAVRAALELVSLSRCEARLGPGVGRFGRRVLHVAVTGLADRAAAG